MNYQYDDYCDGNKVYKGVNTIKNTKNEVREIEYEVEIMRGIEFTEFDAYREIVACDLVTRPDTAIVTIMENGEKIIKKYGYVDVEDIYKLIYEGKEVNLNHTYIKDFSIKKCISYKNNNTPIKPINISAINCFFDCTTETNFDETVFKEGTKYFTGATFCKFVRFLDAKFSNGDVLFNSARFLGSANFTRCKFGEGNITFNNAIVKDNLDLAWAQFNNNNINMMSLYVGNYLRFEDSAIPGYVDMRMKCKCLSLDSCKIEKIIDMSVTEGLDVDINELSIIYTDIIGRIKLNWKKNKVKNMIKKSKDINYYNKAHQFRLLKENFRNLGQYDDEDNAYVYFKKYSMLSILLCDSVQNIFIRIVGILWNGLWFLPKKILLDWIGGYGTKPKSVLITMVLTVLAFAIAYMYLPIMDINFSSSKIENDVMKSIYYSGITFLTIGYGDISPQNEITALTSVIEGFLGIFLMSYFTVSFVRKLLR